jgi:methionyl-tRNA synthetase
MLKALGFADDEMPTLLVHGWWNIAGAKMSKSTGNIVDPDALADKYGAETLRYYLMADIATGRDADFSEQRLVMRYNTDLANSLGNLLNRSLNMAAKYRSGKVMRWAVPLDGRFEDRVSRYSEAMMGSIAAPDTKAVPIDENDEAVNAEFDTILSAFSVHKALESAVGIAGFCNREIDRAKPWDLAKDPEKAETLERILYSLAESLRVIAILLSVVLPKAAHGIFDQLNWKMDERGKETRFRLADAAWGGLPDGHVLGKPVPLFPRIEVPAS